VEEEIHKRSDLEYRFVNDYPLIIVYLKRLFLISLLIFIASPFPLISQDFPCDGSFYFVATDEDGSRFYRLAMNEVTHSFTYEQLPLDNPDKRHITSLGYNVKDKMIYGLDFNSYELLRIGSDGKIEVLPVPENLDTSFHYYAGEMTPDGRRLVVIGRHPESGIDNRIYSIRVNNPPDYYAGFFSVVSDLPVSMSDITVDPIVGATYGFDINNQQIVVTDRTGLTATSTVRRFKKVNEEFGALFFDRLGQMYGLGSAATGGQQNTMYEIDKSFGATQKLGEAIGGFDTDGCGCPYTVEVFKRAVPRSSTGCEQIVLEYNIVNWAGIGQVSTRLTDTLPEEFRIVDITAKNQFLNVQNSIGTNILEIKDWTLVMGENIALVTVEVHDVGPNQLSSQAKLDNLPAALDFEIFSDDPLTTEIDDPTILVVIPPDSIRLEDYQWNSCESDTTFLTVPVSGQFTWSDGSTDPVLNVVDNGWHSVEVVNECFTFIDSIYVTKDFQILEVSLGTDRNYSLGDEVVLDFSTNAKSVSAIKWQGPESAKMACYDCNQAVFTAIANATITLTVTDERGCSASDQIQIRVDETRRIFVPNAFSPNNDGINDRLFVHGKAGAVNSFKVYDRWGALVFDQEGLSMTDSGDGWDGSYQGAKVAPGVYIWTAKILFADGATDQLTGQILVFY